MSTLSKAIHDAIAIVERWIKRMEGESDPGPAPPEVKAAIATIKAQANAVDPKLPAATVQSSPPKTG